MSRSSLKTRWQALGFLRQGLLSMAVISILVPALYWLLQQAGIDFDEYSMLAVSSWLIAPVMAPLLLVVIFFDMLMSKIRAADEPGEQGQFFKQTAQIETLMLFVMLAFWVPYFIVVI